MWPFLGGLVTGGASLLGSIFSSETSASNTQAQIAASQQQQATQNAFSERMSSTAYQRASQDMQAAGLNPAMMFGSGSAASSPTGSSIQAPMPQNTSPMAGLGKAVESGINAMVSAKTIDKLGEEVANLKQRTATEEYETPKRRQEMLTEVERTNLIGAQKELAKLGYNPALFTSMEAKQIIELAKEHPEIFKNLQGSDYLSKKTTSLTDQISSGLGSAIGVKRLGLEAKKLEEAKKPRRSSTQESGTDASGKWYDRFRDTKEWRD